MKHVDKGTKGYIALGNFLEKLSNLAVETKEDAFLRSFSLNVKRQGINLKAELIKYDNTKSGRLDRKTFTKAIN
jgi:Ca2+-binding EF-hand superfamily protein